MRRLAAVPVLALLAPALVALPGAPPAAAEPGPPKVPTAVGTGGAVSSVDPEATRVGLAVLRSGGNAADAAVATAAALGVTEPYSAGIGGGGYFVHYDASTGKVATIDGRETAPAGIEPDAFVDPATGEPYRFTPELVTSGVSVGVPGTPATWQRALDRWGTRSLKQVLGRPAALARRGFVVDATFRQQTADNRARFRAFTSTKRLFLRDGRLPAVGERFRNPALARTYDLLRRDGLEPFYRGAIGADVVRAVRRPPVTAGTDLPVPPGTMTRRDLRDYRLRERAATRTTYRGLDVHGMPPSSSGGSTVGEALEILERHDLAAMDDAQALHLYLEASARAFADRAAYVGDPAFVDVPLADLLSPTFAAERDCTIDPERAAEKPVEPGDVTSYDGECATDAPAAPVEAPDTENVETTHLVVADRWGDVVSYTLTIEQTGGSGIVVPGRGFLLNNELTDFTTVYDAADPNRIQPGKRPRSSMSPTIVLRDGKPVLALGSPGGSTIITTVLQLLVERFDRGRTIAEAMAAPRASQRNTATVTAEPGFIDAYGPLLEAYGHRLVPAGDALTSAAEIGAAAAVEIGPGGLLTAVAEPARRGGGSAGVVRPQRSP
ncbi:gamma-glutamyltransferase [Nocardioides sp. zg-579]|uniref:Glutathione hydrolase proenzyme n=1 Tax=Nocardioides marmotae TaxID=2663857 RepID=A0A6I3J9D5_9ACTN|nr:gamma-glutamyltransferase [Nocardioides marmotae]MCR6030314.1 gamma-glutamyltransferase [Gordonia jinghuaiqii]MTB93948.1 gamma-glutamyltransferase [Nocardioides marmotae]QKE00263.1 gamma-glutamyltransferase [Nocardioides marmotae]